MRGVVTFGGLSVVIIVIVMIHTAIISLSLRQNEVSCALKQACDYSIDRAICDINNDAETEENLEEFMSDFCNMMSKEMQSDGEVNVFLKDFDLQNGIIDVKVVEGFEYGYMNRMGSVIYERAYKIY